MVLLTQPNVVVGFLYNSFVRHESHRQSEVKLRLCLSKSSLKDKTYGFISMSYQSPSWTKALRTLFSTRVCFIMCGVRMMNRSIVLSLSNVGYDSFCSWNHRIDSDHSMTTFSSCSVGSFDFHLMIYASQVGDVILEQGDFPSLESSRTRLLSGEVRKGVQ
jgi:hypothetical protein